MPNARNVDILLPFILIGCDRFEINTSKRENCFLAQVALESGEFRYLKELASGEEYEGRLDLGNIEAGDGVKFKGRGLIQLTGRANYAKISADLEVDFIDNPALLETPEYASISACWFWNSHKLNDLADQDLFIAITRRINGGTNGLVQRQAYWAKAKLLNP